MNYSRGKICTGQEYLQASDWTRSNRLDTNRLVKGQVLGDKTSQKIQNVKHKYNTHQINHNTSITHYNIIHKQGTLQFRFSCTWSEHP